MHQELIEFFKTEGGILTIEDVKAACRNYIGRKTKGIDAIATERYRQISIEGFDANHDTFNKNNELSWAAIAYAMPKNLEIFIDSTGIKLEIDRARIFPPSWQPYWFKLSPENRLKELAKAGALIAAEYDRIVNSKK